MVRLLDAARGDGLVRRDARPADRRRRVVSLTPEGETGAGARRSRRPTAVQDELLAPLSAAERRTLHELLERLLRLTSACGRAGTG